MPRLVNGGKWAYGWVAVGKRRRIVIPPQAWQDYGFREGGEALFLPGSGKSGGFSISRPALLAEASEKMGTPGLPELGRARFGSGGLVLPPEMKVKPGDRLLAVRGSRYGLGFAARGPIYAEALKHPELAVY